MRLVVILAAMLVTGTIFLVLPVAVLWFINPAALFLNASHYRNFFPIVPALVPLFIAPAVAMAIWRRHQAK